MTGTIGEAPYRDQCNPVLSILSSSFRCKTNKGVGLRGKVSIFFVQGCLGAILVCQCIEAAVGLLSDCTFGEKIHRAYM